MRGGTYFSLPPQRKVGKRKRLEAPAKWAPWSATGSGATGIRALAHSAVVTKESSAPTPHCVRRGRVCLGNHGVRLRFVGAVGFASATRLCIYAEIPLQTTSRCTAITVSATITVAAAVDACHCRSDHNRGGGGVMTSHSAVARSRRQNAAIGFMNCSSARAAPPEV